MHQSILHVQGISFFLKKKILAIETKGSMKSTIKPSVGAEEITNFTVVGLHVSIQRRKALLHPGPAQSEDHGVEQTITLCFNYINQHLIADLGDGGGNIVKRSLLTSRVGPTRGGEVVTVPRHQVPFVVRTQAASPF